MREIATRKEKTRTIEVPTRGFYFVYSYETEDGKIFKDKEEAEHHEEELKYAEVTCLEIPYIRSIGTFWHKAKNQEELDLIIKYLSDHCKASGMENLKVGEWFCVLYDYDPNGPDTADFVPLSYYKEKFNELLELLQ